MRFHSHRKVSKLKISKDRFASPNHLMIPRVVVLGVIGVADNEFKVICRIGAEVDDFSNKS